MKQLYVVFIVLAIAVTGCQRKEYLEIPTASSTDADSLVTVNSISTASLGVNVNLLGIYGDGKTDYSSRIQEALNKYTALFFPSGNYLITQTLTLNYKQSLTGTAQSTFTIQNGSRYFNNSENYFFSANATDNIQLSMLGFAGSSDASKSFYALLINGGSNGVSINKLTCKNCGLVRSKLNDLPYASIASGGYKLNSNIVIDSCNAEGSNGNGMGVYLEYVSNWKVSHCTLANFYHGVEWWGGDSNPQRDGALANKRMVTNGEITDVTVNHISQGGIWGSMGDGIVVSNCKVNNCGDVGIDFEGCFNAKAINNTASNCNNGCLATFHLNKGIVFSANTITQDNPEYPMACIYNASQSQQNKEIAFSNNTFKANTGVGRITQSGPADSILFTDNKLYNVALNLTFNNNRRVHITGNQFSITAQAGTTNFVIKAGDTNSGGIVTIDNNTITNDANINNALYGIYVTQMDYNSQPVNNIVNNTITGVKTRFKVEWNGMNPGITCKTYLHSLLAIQLTDIAKVDNGSTRSEVYINGTKQQL